ncbi:TetR/AcrR family transcriptional regulator [Papillibacter cinnamivorans]|uniref:Transcriptional regulator, TetR family n=1 Tax=Papillibacter cinnamivorans DSM 12816 TaxID=1122930 RepID=A0A1W2C381_9FIRM|nr:TetR/AcrR family transcriptional regulator [Papillibacter cinnamivorans]SMC79484.1 transcriptional regulator, TetR family [Papillibacter cinnamivorans DSM 12816]
MNKIFEAAEKLSVEKSYFEYTITDVTNLAGIGMGTFYTYFNDKFSLHRYMLQYYSHEIRMVTSMASDEYTTRYQKEFYGLKAYLQYIQEHPVAYRIIWESQLTDPEFFKSYYENFCEKYLAGLQEGVERGEVLDCNLTAAAYLIMGGYSLYGLKLVIFDKKEQVTNQDVYNIMRILRHGLFPYPKPKSRSFSPVFDDTGREIPAESEE